MGTVLVRELSQEACQRMEWRPSCYGNYHGRLVKWSECRLVTRIVMGGLSNGDRLGTGIVRGGMLDGVNGDRLVTGM